MKTMKSFRGKRELTLQKFEAPNGAGQMSTLYGEFSYSDVQKLLKDGYEILTNWDYCRQLNKRKDNEINVRRVLQDAKRERQGQKAVI